MLARSVGIGLLMARRRVSGVTQTQKIDCSPGEDHGMLQGCIVWMVMSAAVRERERETSMLG